MFLINGEVFIKHSFSNKTIRIADGRIEVLDREAAIPSGAEIYDAEGKKIVPGFIDIHTHGAMGVDVN